MEVNVRRIDDPGNERLVYEVSFDENDIRHLVAFKPAGDGPWIKVTGRPPSEILGDLSLWAALLERRVPIKV